MKSLTLRYILLSISLTPLLVSCGTVSQVQATKALATQGRYSEIADQEVKCQASDDGCNQLHLMRGDACFRERNSDSSREVHYLNCAVDELEQGIATTRDWNDMQSVLGKRAQYYENLCEALRQLQDIQNRPEATVTNRRLLSAAKAFQKDEPGHLAAPFFVHSASFAQFQLDPERLKNASAACTDLNKQLSELSALQERVSTSPYVPNYRRLSLDISGIKRTIKGCQ